MSFGRRLPGMRAWHMRRHRQICVEVSTHIDQIVDGELPPGRKTTLIEAHLSGCSYCRGQADSVRRLKQHIARVGSDCDAETVERLRNLARRLCSGEECDLT